MVLPELSPVWPPKGCDTMPSEPKQLKSGNWRSQVSTGVKNDKGRYIYDSVTAGTSKEAFRLALNLEDDYKQKRRDPTAITLDAAITKYENERSNVLSPSTIRGYEIIRKNRFKDLMQTKLSKINKQTLQDAVNKETLLCAPKTVSNAHAARNDRCRGLYGSANNRRKAAANHRGGKSISRHRSDHEIH